MPWAYNIDAIENLVVVKASGVITESEILLGAHELYQDPTFHPDLNCLLDYSEVTDWQISNEFLALMASKRRYTEKSRTAICATGPLGYGISRVYHGWVTKGLVMIFEDRVSAEAWLKA